MDSEKELLDAFDRVVMKTFPILSASPVRGAKCRRNLRNRPRTLNSPIRSRLYASTARSLSGIREHKLDLAVEVH
jgi:hypothetical protein